MNFVIYDALKVEEILKAQQKIQHSVYIVPNQKVKSKKLSLSV